MILSEKRSVIETLKYSDRHKKLLDSVLLDKLKLDGELDLEEEKANEEMVKEYKAIKEKEDLGVFVLPIRRDNVKLVDDRISMLDHSTAEPMGILKDVLCQVRVTIILAKFLILDIPVNRDVPIVVRRSFLYTCGGVINTIKKTTTNFDGVCHQKFYVDEVKNNLGESDSDDEEDYCLKRDKMGKPFYGPNRARYLNYDDHMDHALALQEDLNPFKKKCVWKKAIAFLGSLPVPLQYQEWRPSRLGNITKEGGDGKWHTKIRIMDPYGNTYEQGILERMTMKQVRVNEMGSDELLFTSEAWRRAFDINEPIYTELCNEFYATFEFDEAVPNDELMTKKVIKFRLCGRAHSLSVLDFAKCLGLYSNVEIQDDGFETYFLGGLKNDDHFNANQYWLSISSDEDLTLSRSSVKTIRKPVPRVLQKMITYGLCQRTTGYDRVQIAKKLGILSDEVLNRLSTPTYCRQLDANTLRELIGSNGRLIPEDIA
ncbi:hypothetical protein Tco_0595810 [Tanacetum coccineum]